MTTERNDDVANDSTSDRADGEFVPWGPPMVPTTVGHARDTVDAVCKFNNRKPGAPRPVGHTHNTVDAVFFEYHYKQPSAPRVSDSGHGQRKRQRT